MTGRELIMYILENKLEDVDVYEFIFYSDAFLDIHQVARKFEVGEATVNAWVTSGYLKAFVINGKLRIPSNAKPIIPIRKD